MSDPITYNNTPIAANFVQVVGDTFTFCGKITNYNPVTGLETDYDLTDVAVAFVVKKGDTIVHQQLSASFDADGVVTFNIAAGTTEDFTACEHKYLIKITTQTDIVRTIWAGTILFTKAI